MTPGPYYPRRRRRGREAHAGAVQAVHRARAGDRPEARQADDRLGRDRARHAAADVDRAALAARRLGRRPPSRAPQLILSPANRTYLDMKYDDDDGARAELGGQHLRAARLRLGSRDARARASPKARCSASRRRSGPRRSCTMRDVEYMAFPRLAAVAEVAWSPADRRQWDDFARRLGAQAPRWHGARRQLPSDGRGVLGTLRAPATNSCVTHRSSVPVLPGE